MISKELLSEVLGINIDENDIYIKNNYIYYAYCRSDNEWINASSNIYELAHKCKEWALSKEYVISSHSKYKLDGYNCILYCNNGEIDEDFTSDTEPGAIFKACEWILDNIKES